MPNSKFHVVQAPRHHAQLTPWHRPKYVVRFSGVQPGDSVEVFWIRLLRPQKLLAWVSNQNREVRAGGVVAHTTGDEVRLGFCDFFPQIEVVRLYSDRVGTA